jgi:isoaspartyl peptidase/L-asparaginase-like protein (Ntn-hydrolase superfamily)
MRVCLAKSVIDLVRSDAAVDPQAAARASLVMLHERTGEAGGAIVASRDGAMGLARTTQTMGWAAVTDDGTRASGS